MGKKVLSTIYKPNVDFSRGADEDCWWNCIDTTGIVCDLFKINIVIYCLPNPKTLAFEFFTNEIKYTEIDKKNDLEIAQQFKNNIQNTIYMVYLNENHFLHFKKYH